MFLVPPVHWSLYRTGQDTRSVPGLHLPARFMKTPDTISPPLVWDHVWKDGSLTRNRVSLSVYRVILVSLSLVMSLVSLVVVTLSLSLPPSVVSIRPYVTCVGCETFMECFLTCPVADYPGVNKWVASCEAVRLDNPCLVQVRSLYSQVYQRSGQQVTIMTILSMQ